MAGLGGEGLAQAATDEFAELENGGVGDGVEHLEALFAAGHEAGGGEGLEVARDVGLGAAGGFDEGVHGTLAAHETLQDTQAHGLAEHGETTRHQLERLLVERFGCLGHAGDKRRGLTVGQVYAHMLILWTIKR